MAYEALVSFIAAGVAVVVVLNVWVKARRMGSEAIMTMALTVAAVLIVLFLIFALWSDWNGDIMRRAIEK